jgi:2-polyprenyl-3-methyl-5-hydroxy-6-metoxy-1,4-benzoquinol methylase
VTFVDVSQKALALARSRVPEKYLSSVEFRNEDILSAEFDEVHDVVISVGTLAHVARPYDVLRRLVELTRHGGLLILQNTDCRHFRSVLQGFARKVVESRTYSLNSLSDAEIRSFLTANGLVLDRVYRYSVAPMGFQRIFSQESLYRQTRRIHGTSDRNTNTWLANEYIYCFRRRDKTVVTPAYRLEQQTGSAANCGLRNSF